MPGWDPDYFGVMDDPDRPRFESLPERLIREAIERGEFDHPAGEGQPIPGAGTRDDDLWWVRGWVRRNRAESAEPPAAN